VREKFPQEWESGIVMGMNWDDNVNGNVFTVTGEIAIIKSRSCTIYRPLAWASAAGWCYVSGMQGCNTVITVLQYLLQYFYFYSIANGITTLLISTIELSLSLAILARAIYCNTSQQ